MIHFDPELVSDAIEAAKDVAELMDVTKDLQQIKNAEGKRQISPRLARTQRK